ncbi:helix-turn-helix transcriptional regulator, partial [Candidatus Liberibacter sp.]|uniref:helix-turn-helix transcriptional regulator n=1 Tax=Candidatus Liberibacter sp. TaxID=34022 RepID=UPI0021755AE3
YSLEILNEYNLIITPEIRQYWEAVGTRIRDIRKANNKTLKEMAIGANLLENAVCKFEKGICSTSINYALYLRNEYGASFDWIYDGEMIDRRYEDIIQKKPLNPKEIGIRIKEVRKAKGMTQVEFGNLISITNVGVGDIEIRLSTPRIETSLKIKKVTKKHLDWIYFGDKIIVPKSVIRAQKAKSAKSK